MDSLSTLSIPPSFGKFMNAEYMTTPFLMSAELEGFLEVPRDSALSHAEILSMIQTKCRNSKYVVDPHNRLSVLFSLGLDNITVTRYFSLIDLNMRGPPPAATEPAASEEMRVELGGEEAGAPETVSPYEQLLRQMRAYVLERSPKLYILTPCFGGQCFVNFVTSILETKELFRQAGFPLIIEFVKNDSLVSRARNNLVARAMSDPEMTHVIFIDNDITWNPVDIFRMVLADKPVLGGVYPLKKYHWGKLVPGAEPSGEGGPQAQWIANKRASRLSFMGDEYTVQAKMLKYNVNYLNDNLNIDSGGLAEVKHVATGFMLIQRTVFSQMFAEFPLEKYTDDVGCLSKSENEFAYALFDCGVREGHYFSEDWLFCDRWTKLGGGVWIDVNIFLVHTGTEDYAGSYISSLII